MTLKGLVQEGAPPNGTEQCDKYVTLECLREMYNFRYDPVVPKQNKVAVGGSTMCECIYTTLTVV